MPIPFRDAMKDLRVRLQEVLKRGIPTDALQHAALVAEVSGVLHEAFERRGLRCTVVGGSAIEIHAPGVYKSGDIDLVVDSIRNEHLDDRIREVFEALEFSSRGRHWSIGDLFIEVPSHDLSDPFEVLTYGHAVFQVVKKEVVLADRIVGFKHWGYTAYGQQAIDMLAAFEGDLEMSWLEGKLKKEASWDAFEALRKLAASGEPVTEEGLQDLLTSLRRKP